MAKQRQVATTGWRERVGLQIFTLGLTPTSQLRGAIDETAEVGMHLIEFQYDGIDEPVLDLRKAVSDRGLRCASFKVPPVSFQEGQRSLESDIETVIDDALQMGIEFVVAMVYAPASGRLPEPLPNESMVQRMERAGREMTEADWLRHAERLNQWGVRLRREGLRLAFHNTNFDFSPIDGVTGLELVLENTDPNLVWCELDVGYALSGGAKPEALIDRYSGRVALLHMKDIDSKSPRPNFECFQSGWTALGTGIGNWPAIIGAAERGNCAYYYIEDEPPFPARPMDRVRESLAYLDQLASVDAAVDANRAIG